MRPATLLFCAVLCIFSPFSFQLPAVAQQTPVQPRIRQAVDEAVLTRLSGNTHPLALARFDRGTAAASMPLDRMLLVLKRSPEQDAALLRLLDEQQDKSSPNYHKWLSPEEFGQRFGPADADIQAVTGWLQTHGFTIKQVSKGRSVIEFSGTAAMVQDAFRTEIHKYVVGGQPHWANASDPQIPDALTPVVGGVWTLHNFPKKPSLVMSDEHFPLTSAVGSSKPLATSSSGAHFLSPGDFAVIYGAKPVYQAGIDGTGVIIAVLGRTDLAWADIYDFRNVFGMGTPNLNVYVNGPDPGDLGGGEQAEAVLDATWSGAIAPGAQVLFVASASTNTTDGVDLSELYVIDNNAADIMTESFGSCEAGATSAEREGINALAEQAAAQGITYLVSTGDTGSAGCDNLSETTATGPVSVNVLASTPFNVAVGGTIFNENGRPATYWSSNTGAPVTALKYIPEKVWNESCTSTSCGNNANIAAGGGGPSSSVAKPAWQAGVNLHIPNDGFRDIPDVSLTAALHDPYLICLAGSCSQQGFLVGIGGTSASAPSFAGIMALATQKLRQVHQNPTERIGLANYVLYRLADAETLSQCNGSSTSTSLGTSCVFSDITTGNNAVPGETSYGGSSPQFAAASGYDLATGLGSVQVNNLLNAWAAVTYNPTTTTLTLTPTTITHGAAVQANITVAPSGGSTSPSGDVSLLAFNGHMQGVGSLHLTNGASAGTINALTGGASYNVSAHYSGDANFAPSDSAPVLVTVNAEPSSTSVKVLSADDKGQPIPFTTGPYGSFVYVRADVSGSSGVGFPSGNVLVFDNGGFLNNFPLNSQGNTATPNGMYTFSVGTHAITASYTGDGSFLSNGPSPATSFTITKGATSATVQASANPVGSGSLVTLTATIDTTSRGNTPSGGITFFNGNNQLASNIPLGTAPVSPAGYARSTASYTLSLPDGTNNITAQYLGDTNYSGSSSTAVAVNVAPDFSLGFTGSSGSTMSISSPGSSGSLTLTVTGTAGYNGTVNFTSTACSGLPSYSNCTFSPSSVTGNGSSTVTITTTAPHIVLPQAGTTARTLWLASGGLALGGVFVAGFAPGKRRWISLLMMLLMAGLLTLEGCGGSGGGGASRTPGTPRGTYQVSVTGADANFKHQIAFTVTVQ